jgi:demethylmenaquinone methyltransferase/2-methoxy-6-polyprenyl-1,4-benzoquinol methylase
VIDELDALLAEQADYYRARAAEYDTTVGYAPDTRSALIAAIERFAPRGRVLELACGTGQWTQVLAKTASELTAVDSSAEMLERNRARLRRPKVNYVQADLFAWNPPPHRFDVVFFAAWLSHVPPQRFDAFWGQVASALADGGRVFVIDELPAVAAEEIRVAGAPAPAVHRQLATGARYCAIKVFYEEGELERRTSELGFALEVHPVDWRFYYAIASLH